MSDKDPIKDPLLPSPADGGSAPDEDEGFFSIVRERLGRMMGRPFASRRSSPTALGLLVLVWLATGIYRVEPEEVGVVQRFGAWVETTGPGLHLHLPWPIDTASFPKITQINQMRLGGTASDGTIIPNQMLTGDENIVEADSSVFWQISDASRFLFKVSDPEFMLKTDAESALREVIARWPIQAELSDRRQQIADETRVLLQQLLDDEQSGIRVIQIQLQRIDPPGAVIDAFNDVQRARADQERARNEAQAYANDILPRARGDAERMKRDAEAYKVQVINLARGEAVSFTAALSAWSRGREVVGWRLYLEGIDEILKRAGKVILDTSGHGTGPVLPYLPLSDTARAATSPPGTGVPGTGASAGATQNGAPAPLVPGKVGP